MFIKIAQKLRGYKDKKWFWIMLGAMVLLLFVGLALARNAQNGDGGQAVDTEKVLPVEVVKASIMPFGSGFSVAGTVNPTMEVVVSPKASGKVASVSVKVGQEVKAGSPLFKLDSIDAQLAYQQSQAQVAMQEAGRAQANTNYENARLNYERMKMLIAEGAISQSQLEQASGQLAAAQSARDMNIAQVNQSRAMLGTASQNLSNFSITSPIEGRVAKVSVELGEMVSPQTQAVVVIKDWPLLVKVTIPETVVASVKLEQDVDVFVASLGKTVKGKVHTLAPQADQVTRGFAAEIMLGQGAEDIRPGMTAELLITTKQDEKALVVPTDAVMELQDGSIVYVVENQIAKSRKVKLGMTGKGYTQIVSGLKEGEEVVVKGNRLLVDGMKVEGQAFEAPAQAGGDK